MLRHARRRALFAVAALPIYASAAGAPVCPDPATANGGLGEPLATVRPLADDALQGRLAGSAGERCAADLQGFTDALAAHQPGDTVDIVVLRGNAEVRVPVTLGSRGGGAVMPTGTSCRAYGNGS